MILERGDMWSVFGKTGFFLITTNPIMRKDGAVVMGRGIAKQMKDKYPDSPYEFGNKLKRLKKFPTVGIMGTYDGQDVGYFMVKDHWRNEADPFIIANSTEALIRTIEGIAECLSVTPVPRFDLNFPGIGNGRLSRETVLPIIARLPDNVHVWEFE